MLPDRQMTIDIGPLLNQETGPGLNRKQFSFHCQSPRLVESSTCLRSVAEPAILEEPDIGLRILSCCYRAPSMGAQWVSCLQRGKSYRSQSFLRAAQFLPDCVRCSTGRRAVYTEPAFAGSQSQIFLRHIEALAYVQQTSYGRIPKLVRDSLVNLVEPDSRAVNSLALAIDASQSNLRHA